MVDPHLQQKLNFRSSPAAEILADYSAVVALEIFQDFEVSIMLTLENDRSHYNYVILTNTCCFRSQYFGESIETATPVSVHYCS